MVRSLRFTPEAVQDWDVAMGWYEAARPGLGKEFSLELETAFARIKDNPLCGSFVLKRRGIRRVLLKRFPYKVIYHQVEDVIEVVAIFHDRRHPRSWQARLADD